MRIRDSGRGPGWDQASQAESGDQDSPAIGPSSDAASSVTCPGMALGVHVHDQQPAVVGGGRDRSPVRGSGQAGHRAEKTFGEPNGAWLTGHGTDFQRVGVLGPAASVTHATFPVSPSTRGSRARAPGSTCSARAGPSLCVSQCTVPRTSTTLACPVRSQIQVTQMISGGDQPRRTSRGRGAER